ncbi:hypothetical protein [Streptomyces durocortorensis]|uniref:AAA+ ATPase domain-containing protein n=1 Tax=Streptomyces durocortorensis TaxID=2811104 RepID=A0ABS2HT76_9ACTN|nr:hypothetical protein [Streptomyces durocortorensis]MBM7052958.1 hypothetical protein [Streptomyces durocortorensis]
MPFSVAGEASDTPALTDALEALAQALRALPSPVGAAIEQLQQADVEHALNSTPMQWRRHILGALRIPVAGTRVSPALCRDVLTRMGRDPVSAKSRHAASHLTQPLLNDLLLAADSGEPLTRRWSPVLLRLAGWVHLRVSEEDGALWLWALEQPWMTDGLPPKTIAAVREAARRVAELAPAPQPPGAENDSTCSGTEPAVTAAPQEPVDHDGSVGLQPDAAALTVAVERVERVLAAAREPVRRLADSVSAQSRPADSDLVSLHELTAAFDDALAGFRTFGAEPAPDLGSLRERAVSVAETLASEALRTRLADVDGLRRAPGSASALSAVVSEAREAARALLARADWSQQDSSDAEALGILLRMVELAHSGEERSAEILGLLQEMSAKAPAFLVLAAQCGDLTLGPAPDADLASSPGTDTEPAQDTTADGAAGAVAEPAAGGGTGADSEPGEAAHSDAVRAHGDLDTSGPHPHGSPRTTEPGPPRPGAPADRGVASGPRRDPAPGEDRQPAELPAQPEAPSRSTEAADGSLLTAARHRPPSPAPASAQPPASSAHLPQQRPLPAGKTDPALGSGESPEAVLAPLVAEHRYGAAAALAEQNAEPVCRSSALRISAYALALRSSSGECASRVRAELAGIDVDALVRSRPDAALVTAALLRVVLVTGDAETSAPLQQVAAVLPPSLVSVADEVSRCALQSMLLHSPPLALARGTAELERFLQEAREECQQGLDQLPRIRFNRATEITRLWLAPSGLIGSLLQRAADDDRDGLDEVADGVRKLANGSALQDELNEVDRRLMRSSRSRLEGPARQNLLRLMNDRLRSVDKWVVAARALDVGANDWSVDQVQAMRAAVLALRDHVLDDLSAQSLADDAYTQAAMRAAADSLRLTFDLLSGDTRLDPAEYPAEVVLGRDLLKLPGVRVEEATGRVIPPELTAERIMESARRSWLDVIDSHRAAERFDLAAHLLGLSEMRLLPPGPNGHEELTDESVHLAVGEAARHTAAALEGKRRVLEDSLRRTRVNGVFKEEEERDFEHRLQAPALTTKSDLASARQRLDGLSEELERAHATATAKLRARLMEIPGLKAEDFARVTPLLDDGDLLTAEELISHLSNGESIPDTRYGDHPLNAFFPSVPDALPQGITEELIRAVRNRQRFQNLDALDFSAMSQEFTDQAANGLAGWREMASRRGVRRTEGLSEENLLMPALRLIGYRSLRKPQRDRQRSTTPEHRFLDLQEVRYTGEALVPSFGSALRGRLRVMLAWGQPTPEALMARVQQNPSQESLLVAYFGTLSAHARTLLAALSVGRRPMVVLDDAALAYLAARGNQLLDPAMRVLLPFSAVNPYVSEKRGRVAEEMFFGRLEELGSVQNPVGNQVVFGGRGLGKSALLKEAGRKFTAQAPTAHISMAISLDSTYNGTSAQSSAVWNLIGRRLLEEDALPLPKRVRADATLTYDNVLTGIRTWLKADSSRRMLIMLDEADGFFESDSPRFTETRRLRDLSSETNDGVKIVFAGLHSVQRYATLAANNPFSHLSQHPTVIGPLQPQDAANLLLKPLAALGYQFLEPQLVHRILGHCSYQPFLLQMFAHRLVQTMHAKRREAKSGPLHFIARDDVERVQSDKDLQRSITAAFHDTLRLDSRYNMIANVVAHHAHHHGIDARMTHAELRDECTYWWAEGFRDLDPDQFRAYLTEMEGLGVLAPDPDHRGWHLRSANALSMIGTLEDVDAQLENTSSRQVTERLTALETRHKSAKSHSHCPLTAAQIADILPGRQVSGSEPGRRNLARVVLGSPATGVNRVTTALREIAETTGWKMPHVARRADFERELVGGEPGMGRLVVSDLTVKSPGEQSCLISPELATTRKPDGPGVTRSAVVVAGLEQLTLWASLLSDDQTSGVGVVPLRRFTRHGLRTWSLDQNSFTSEAALQRVAETTGGWPLLVDQLSEQVSRGDSEGAALKSVRGRLESIEGAVDFLAQVGLVPETFRWSAFTAVMEFMTEQGLPFEDLEAAVGAAGLDPGPEATDAIRILRALQVFDVDATGLHSPEPVLLSCWSRVTNS